MIYTDAQTMRQIREKLHTPDGAQYAAWLMKRAEEDAAAPSPCITDYPSPAVSGNPHDYFSEGTYWWPDPNNPGGPYIRRDGCFNPDRFEHHRIAFNSLCDQVLTLATAAYHLDKLSFAEAAKAKIHRFFLDPDTRMNPHLEYAQAIRGICAGRGIGIIDVRRITRLIFAAELLEEMDPQDAVLAGTREWLSAFHHWMRTSKNGIDERFHGNNHSTWYTVMTASLARFLGDEAGFAEDCDYYAAMLRKQMLPTGEFPAETSRADSFGYSCMNLNGFALLCEIAHFAGRDLWNRDCGGVCMSTAIRWQAQYLLRPETWPFRSTNHGAHAPLAMYSASVRLADEEGRAAASEVLRHRNTDPLSDTDPFLPAVFWFCGKQ